MANQTLSPTASTLPEELRHLPRVITDSYSHEIEQKFGERLTRDLALGTVTTDKLGDQVVRDFATMPGGTGWKVLDDLLQSDNQAFEQALTSKRDSQGREIPDSLLELVTQVRNPPDWVNFDLVDEGANVYWKAGPMVIFGLLNSLAFGYRSARISEPMVRTGRIDHMAQKRLFETSRWVVSATTPGSMRISQNGELTEGIRMSIHVRIVHALIRLQLMKDDRWNVDELAMPINDSDSALTIAAGFLSLPVSIWERLGIEYSRDEKQAMNHLWRWIGHVMGVPTHLQAQTYDNAYQMLKCSDAGIDPVGPGSQRLMDALMERGIPYPETKIEPLDKAARLGLQLMHRSMFRFGIGAKRADVLGIKPSPTMPLVTVALPLALRTTQQIQKLPLVPTSKDLGWLARAQVNARLNNYGAPANPVSINDANTESLANAA